MAEADLILLILDAVEGLRDEEKVLLEQLPEGKAIVVWNKCDLVEPKEKLAISTVCVSAKEKSGLAQLHGAIDKIVWDHGPPARDEVVVTSQRHREALLACLAALDRFSAGLAEGISPEFLALEVRESLGHLGSILGTNVGEDILSAIFSTFCVGK
jgi:tRNA modification GTPase